MDPIARILDPKDALAFILAGKATFTLRSAKTGKRYTLRVTESNTPDFFFVSLLDGPNNEQDYVYLGVISERRFKLTKKSRMNADSPPVQAITWTLQQLNAGRLPDTLEFWHIGQCGRCGRPLTVPESIASGFGPTCIAFRDAFGYPGG